MLHVTHSFGGTPVLATYRAMEHLVDAGLTRTVGLSNVRADQLEFLLREARIPPAVVEQEVHLYNQESALVSLCRSRGVALLAHSPLGSALARAAARRADARRNREAARRLGRRRHRAAIDRGHRARRRADPRRAVTLRTCAPISPPPRRCRCPCGRRHGDVCRATLATAASARWPKPNLVDAKSTAMT